MSYEEDMREIKGNPTENNNNNISQNMNKWEERLTSEQYEVCIRKGTELPFTGKYWDCKEDGLYRCVCCDNELFDSDTKFDSGTGWPSFWAPAKSQSLRFAEHILAMYLTMVPTQQEKDIVSILHL
jgi:methionine-R-sulfoxide reductase